MANGAEHAFVGRGFRTIVVSEEMWLVRAVRVVTGHASEFTFRIKWVLLLNHGVPIDGVAAIRTIGL